MEKIEKLVKFVVEQFAEHKDKIELSGAFI